MIKTIIISILLISLNLFSAENSSDFGFKSYEIYKTEEGTHSLLTKDIDSDGLKDFMLVNNKSAQIDIYYQLLNKDAEKNKKDFYVDIDEDSVNTLSFDFKYKNIPFITEKNIASFISDNVGGDKKDDLIYLTSTGELFIHYQTKPRDFSKKQVFNIPDFFESMYVIAVEDINSDGKKDVILLSQKYLNIFYQNNKGELDEPLKLSYSAKAPLGIEVVDLNGDGKNDVLFVTSGGVNYLRIRFQEENGKLGPEYAIEYPNFHFLTAKNILTKTKDAELLSSRANAHMIFVDKIEKINDKQSPLPAIHSINKDAVSLDKSILIEDFDGDKKNDMVMFDTNLSSFLFFKGDNNLFEQYVEYPSLKGVKKIASFSINSNQLLLMHSKEEHSLSFLNLKSKKNSFPEIIDLNGDVESFDVYENNIFAIVKKDDKFKTVKFKIEESGKIKIEKTIDMENFTIDSIDMTVRDFNYDGIEDILFFLSYEPAVFYFGTKTGFELFNININAIKSAFQSITPNMMIFEDYDDDGKKDIIISMKNMIRVIGFKSNSFQILYQLNGVNQTSELTNVAVTSLYTDKNSVYSYDKSNKTLLIFDKKTQKIIKTIQVPDLNITQIFSKDINNDKINDLIMTGIDNISIYSSKNEGYYLKNIIKYTLPHPKEVTTALTTGTFNGNKIVSIDDVRNFIQFFNFSENEIRFSMRFKIFETKTYRNDEMTGGGEPRDIRIADMNNDKKDDIVILVHDKIIVYYQE